MTGQDDAFVKTSPPDLQVGRARRFAALFLAAIAGLPLAAGDTSNPTAQKQAARLQFDHDRIRVVSDYDAPEVRASFHFRNLGSRPVRIMAVAASCGCTTAKADRKVVQPGEAEAIEVRLSTAGAFGQRFAHIVVLTDEPGPGKYPLELQADIRRSVTVEPSLLAWNISGPAKPMVAEIVCHTGAPIEVKGDAIDNPIATVAVAPTDSPERLRLIATPTQAMVAGSATVTVTVKFARGGLRTAKLYLRAY